MTIKFLDNFKILDEREDYENVTTAIDKGVVFQGTNLWVLIFAIFIASLGLNVNSTAVIIGAMLISPLMGPIMGMGLGAGINDLALLRKSLQNYLFAALVGLATSTLYFFLSPVNAAHSELLARTSPNIYDVLIALFGGFAGIVATSSKQKGNVIPGVAIATALMPPLCTAGYGLATLHWTFFFGAFYLFIINTVFIGLATFFTVRVFEFPYKQLPDKQAETRAKRIIALLLMLTLLPSIYFGYDIVQQQRFLKKADSFIEKESTLSNDYLLNKKIDARSKTITLTYGGREISADEAAELKNRLLSYDLDTGALKIQQGFAYLKADDQNPETNRLSLELAAKVRNLDALKAVVDSINSTTETGKQVFAELRVNYPALKTAIISPEQIIGADSASVQATTLAVLTFSSTISKTEEDKIEAWLKVRLRVNNVHVIFSQVN